MSFRHILPRPTGSGADRLLPSANNPASVNALQTTSINTPPKTSASPKVAPKSPAKPLTITIPLIPRLDVDTRRIAAPVDAEHPEGHADHDIGLVLLALQRKEILHKRKRDESEPGVSLAEDAGPKAKKPRAVAAPLKKVKPQKPRTSVVPPLQKVELLQAAEPQSTDSSLEPEELTLNNGSTIRVIRRAYKLSSTVKKIQNH